MQPDLPFQIEPEPPRAPAPNEFAAEDRVEFVRVRRARRYILRVRPDGSLRVTIPRGGSRAEATAFAARQVAWIARERARVRREQTPVRWTHGSIISLDGVAVSIEICQTSAGAVAKYGDRVVRVSNLEDLSLIHI